MNLRSICFTDGFGGRSCGTLPMLTVLDREVHMSGDNVANLDERRQVQNGGNGTSGDIRQRLTALGTELKHLATKEDIQKIKVWILVEIIGAAPVSGSLVLLIAKFFVN